MRQFHHPHIIRLYGVVHEQSIYIVMELAPLGQVNILHLVCLFFFKNLSFSANIDILSGCVDQLSQCPAVSN